MIVFPKSPMHPVSLFKIRWFNERDSHILTTRVLVDDPARSQARKHVRWKDIKQMVILSRPFCRPFCILLTRRPLAAQLETLFPYRHPSRCPRSFMDIWGLCSIPGDGDGIQQVESQLLVLGCWVHVASDQHVLGFYRVSTSETSG